MGFIAELRKNESPRKTNTRLFGLLAAVVCLIAFLLTKGNESANVRLPEQSSAESVYAAAAALAGTENSAENGLILYQKYERNPAALHIVNNAQSDARVRLCDGLFNKSVIDFYLCAESELTLNVPVGYYELHVATGASWAGDDQLFGDETLYFTDGSEHGQELGRKATCEFTIEKGFANMLPLAKERY